jgi:hypothetical protein
MTNLFSSIASDLGGTVAQAKPVLIANSFLTRPTARPERARINIAI